MRGQSAEFANGHGEEDEEDEIMDNGIYGDRIGRGNGNDDDDDCMSIHCSVAGKDLRSIFVPNHIVLF